MPSKSPSQRRIDRWERAELDTQRYETLAYIAGRVPLNIEHARFLESKSMRGAETTTDILSTSGVPRQTFGLRAGNFPLLRGRESGEVVTSRPEDSVIRDQADSNDFPQHTATMLSGNDELTLKVTLDVGTEGNWISENTVRKHWLPIVQDLDDETWWDVNGQPSCSLGIVKMDWLRWSDAKSPSLTFHIAPAGSFEIIFGRKLCADAGLFQTTEISEMH